ncbi:hypothetical protein BJ138DRAFT_1105794 [Hygrophoropsis aurantiaca]|uniref:Uncharacterized protein n=1 Tax=Hygrophoropsis aurantiaca TaxID=72124 RepID=A0ACB7ZX17_9AGAM|nr:hypothetical protein BJ138DRAFT_1105794 [Hygrophoropsis aurantiaca]
MAPMSSPARSPLKNYTASPRLAKTMHSSPNIPRRSRPGTDNWHASNKLGELSPISLQVVANIKHRFLPGPAIADIKTVNPPPPPSFSYRVVCRRTTPLYRHSNLRSHLEISASNCDSTDGETSDGACVTDGDDHVWTGDRKTLEGGKWRVIQESSVLGKRLREDINANDTEPHMREIEGTTSGSEYDTLSEEISYNSDHSDEDEMNDLVYSAQAEAEALEEAARIIRSQISHHNTIWLKSLARRQIFKRAKSFVDDIRQMEHSRFRKRNTTWARNVGESWRSQHTMGYHYRSTTLSAPPSSP